MTQPAADSSDRIIEITLDEKSVVRRAPEVEHERAVAIYDLLDQNRFSLASGLTGPFKLLLSISENRLILDCRDQADEPLSQFTLPLLPFRKIIKDYFAVCESYFQAIKTASPSRIEAIDMGRRGLHNDGSTLLQERLAEFAECDFDTARRLFTLICVLHIRG